METMESLVREFKKEREIIMKALSRQDEIIGQMMEADDETKDWVTVKKAAALLDVTPQYLYARKDLEQRHIGSKIYLRWSQCSAIDDKYSVK